MSKFTNKIYWEHNLQTQAHETQITRLIQTL